MTATFLVVLSVILSNTLADAHSSIPVKPNAWGLVNPSDATTFRRVTDLEHYYSSSCDELCQQQLLNRLDMNGDASFWPAGMRVWVLRVADSKTYGELCFIATNRPAPESNYVSTWWTRCANLKPVQSK